MADYDLAIIGAGAMAEAIARGILANNVLSPSRIIAADVSAARRDLFQNQLHIRSVSDAPSAAAAAHNILLSVKPQQMASALAGLAPVLQPDARIISIAAGISTQFIEKHLAAEAPRRHWPVIRTMPNTPMLVGEGVVAIAGGKHASPADLAEARRLFESAAKVLEVSEDFIDAVTAISGSGPAYFFFLTERMIEAGIALGLSPADAHLLATRTALGAGKMLATSADSPAELRRKVTSPNGTTEAAISHLQSQDASKIILDAIHAAAKRSKELGS